MRDVAKFHLDVVGCVDEPCVGHICDEMCQDGVVDAEKLPKIPNCITKQPEQLSGRIAPYIEVKRHLT